MNIKIIILILIIIWFAAFFLPKNPFSDKEMLFRVEKGEGSKEIALSLQKQGVIWWGPLFRLYVLIGGEAGNLQAGVYNVSSSMSISKIAGMFVSGDIAKVRITIPEGFTSEQIYQRLQELSGFNPDSLTELKKHEGYLFPDTYEIPYGLELKKIIGIMRDNFKTKTADLEITPEDVVIASLLEKELQTKEDKAMAAGILWKRLKVGMPLQVDAEMWTYQNSGLPSSPIANPGLESILAAIYPKSSDYWYYLSAPEGLPASHASKTIFSKTLEEHNIAKVKYLK